MHEYGTASTNQANCAKPMKSKFLFKLRLYCICTVFVLGFACFEASAQGLVVSNVQSSYANAVHRSIQQQIINRHFRSVGVIVLTETRNRNGTMTLELAVNRRARLTYQYSTARMKDFLSPVALAKHMIDRLASDKKLVKRTK